MHTSITSNFMLLGDGFEPQHLAKTISLKPSEVWKIGERKIVDNPVLLHKENGWAINVPIKPCMDLEEQIKELISILAPHEEQILQAQKTYKLTAGFSSAVYIHNNEIPSMHFEADIINSIAKFQAFVDIDIYQL